jgi:hypothetical protein
MSSDNRIFGLVSSYQNFAIAYKSTPNRVTSCFMCDRKYSEEKETRNLYITWMNQLEDFWEKEQPGRKSILKKRVVILNRYLPYPIPPRAISNELIERAHLMINFPDKIFTDSFKTSEKLIETAKKVCNAVSELENIFRILTRGQGCPSPYYKELFRVLSEDNSAEEVVLEAIKKLATTIDDHISQEINQSLLRAIGNVEQEIRRGELSPVGNEMQRIIQSPKRTVSKGSNSLIVSEHS